MRFDRSLLLVAMVVFQPFVADARERLLRRLDEQQGLEINTITALAQDARGFIWLGTPGGLTRYDGLEMRRWARASITGTVTQIRPAPDGSLYAVGISGHLLRIEGERVDTVADEAGMLEDVRDLIVEPDGAIWVAARGGVIRRRSADGRWAQAIAGISGARHLRRGLANDLYAATHDAVFRLRDGRLERIAAITSAEDVLPLESGALRILNRKGHLFSVEGGAVIEVHYFPARGMALAERAGVVWASYDRGLVAFHDGAAPEVLLDDQGVKSGGPLLVDQEGSLWVGSFQGLVQFPEPESWVFTRRDGLLGGPRFLIKTSEGIWVTTWAGMGRIDGRAGPAHEEGLVARAQMCLDGEGHLWTSDEEQFLERRDGQFVRHPFPAGEHGAPQGCSTAADGTVWLGLTDALYRTVPGGEPQRIATPALGEDRINVVHEDRRGRIWISIEERACFAPARGPLTAQSWSCSNLEGAFYVTGFVETNLGSLWASSEQGGMLRFDEQRGAWETIPGSFELASRAVVGVSSSPRGGVWISGCGILMRVIDRPDLPAGWQVVEESSWSGLLERSAAFVLEEPDGALWLAFSEGVQLIPAEVRDARAGVPRVEAIEASVDGHRYPRSDAIDLPIEVASGKSRVELSFAALSFRDPHLLRYRVRLDNSAPWSEPTRQPSFRFVDLSAGSYRAQVSASLDGQRWTQDPAQISFHVARPWYLQAWALALFASAIAVIAFSIHRVRLAFRLRLERQRARIAMDLHDELGSALGSIGILAGLASEGALPEGERRDVAAKIADTAGDLGESLGDIVWSLREGSATLDALTAHVAERAARLFPEERPRLSLALPEPLPPLPLSLSVCSNLQRIAFEALHNAARHANASEVELGLGRASGGAWQLWIEDDGCGIAPGKGSASDENKGLGLSSMRTRAEEIGAQLSVGPRPGGGTRVAVKFSLRADVPSPRARTDVRGLGSA